MLKIENLNLVRTNNFYKSESLKAFIIEAALSPFKSLINKANAEYFLKNISFEIKSGERVALLGKNGSGKTTLCKIIASQLFANSGLLNCNFDVKLFSQLESTFFKELSGRENLKYFLKFIYKDTSRHELENLLNSAVQFSGLGQALDRQVETYSSGMLTRLALSLILAKNHDLLILDEMQSYADQEFRRKIKNKITDVINGSNAVIVVTHLVEEVVGICDRGIVLDKGAIIFDGSIDKAITIYNLLCLDKKNE